MTLPSASNLSTAKEGEQVVAITNIDTVNMRATGTNRQGSVGVDIDLRYHVGAIHVMPMLYEQWIVARQGMAWVLVSKLPHNTTDLLTEPVAGQVQIGSTGTTQGPLHLNGSSISVNAPLSVQTTTATTRPDPASFPAGTHIYDTDLGRPIWTNGSDWHDATGRTFYVADCRLELTASIPSSGYWDAYAASGLAITAKSEAAVSQGAHVEAGLEVTAAGSVDLRAGLHYIAHSEQIVIATSGGAAERGMSIDADQAATATLSGGTIHDQTADAAIRLRIQVNAEGEDFFSVTPLDITAAPTGGMTQEMSAEVLDADVSVATTADFTQTLTADAELVIDATPLADHPRALTADAKQWIGVLLIGEMT